MIGQFDNLQPGQEIEFKEELAMCWLNRATLLLCY